MVGHAQLKFVMTECSKTQNRLTRLIWFHVDCQDIGSASFQALQYSNVSWHCLNCNAINYHSVSSNFLDELVLSNSCEPISPLGNGSFLHTFHSDELSIPGDPVHTSSSASTGSKIHARPHTKHKHTSITIKHLKTFKVNLNSIVTFSTDRCNTVDSINPDIIVRVETKIDSSIHLGRFLQSS